MGQKVRQKVRKAVFPAAGLGTRFLPATKAQPKEMLPLVDEPIAVLLGDDIIDSAVPCMRQMVDVFERKGDPVIAVYKVPRDEIDAYGVIDGVADPEDDRVYR